jgi:hypothetical protein
MVASWPDQEPLALEVLAKRSGSASKVSAHSLLQKK